MKIVVKKIISYLIMEGVLLCFIGCNNFSIEEERIETPEYVAHSYTSNLFSRAEKDARRIGMDLGSYAYLYGQTVLNKHGDYVYFDDLTDEEQYEYANTYIRNFENQLIKKLNQTPEMIAPLSAWNKAIDEILQKEYESEEEMYEILLKNLKSTPQSYSATRSGVIADVKENQITKETYNLSSYEIFKENYKKGYILIYPNYEGSGSGLGHCSMMSEDSFDGYDIYNDSYGNEIRELNPLKRATITSFPGDKGATWEGKIGGVQQEPWGYWCYYPSKVYIMKVQNESGEEASDLEYSQAVQYAIKKLGLPYSYRYARKELTNSFYCSSLVFQSWREVGILQQNKKKYYFGSTMVSFISPYDIYASDKTILVTAYTN